MMLFAIIRIQELGCLILQCFDTGVNHALFALGTDKLVVFLSRLDFIDKVLPGGDNIRFKLGVVFLQLVLQVNLTGLVCP
mgnify:CR=1 FL=1